MAIERGKYYYRKRRIGTRVISEYVGKGALAELAMEVDRRGRLQDSMTRENRNHELQKETELDPALNEYDNQVHDLLTAAYLLSGYHLHKRQWRKRRESKEL